MIDGIVKVKEVIENNVDDDTSNSSESPPSGRVNKRKCAEAAAGHSYNFRTPSSVLKQRNSVTISPCYSATSNSNSPSPYFTPEQSVKRPRRRKQLLDSLMFDVEEDSKPPIIKLPPCSEVKEGIRRLKAENLTIEKLDSDTDSCSDMAMPSVYCTFCSNRYKSIDDLEAHILKCPSKKDLPFVENATPAVDFFENKLKVYLCFFCEQEFFQRMALKNHLNDHLREKVLNDIVQLENDFDLRPESNFVHQYFSYFTAGYKFGVRDKGASSRDELQFKFYERLLKDNKYEVHTRERD